MFKFFLAQTLISLLLSTGIDILTNHTINWRLNVLLAIGIGGLVTLIFFLIKND